MWILFLLCVWVIGVGPFIVVPAAIYAYWKEQLGKSEFDVVISRVSTEVPESCQSAGVVFDRDGKHLFDFIPYSEQEAYFTIKYLEYLPMKKVISEDEFRRYITHPNYFTVQLRDKDVEKLVDIFRDVKERASNIEITRTSTYSPWEFWRDIFFSRLTSAESRLHESHESKDEKYWRERINNIEKIRDYFNEFEKAPRISGDLVVELEDLFDRVISKEHQIKELMKEMIDAWREYKLVQYYNSL